MKQQQTTKRPHVIKGAARNRRDDLASEAIKDAPDAACVGAT